MYIQLENVSSSRTTLGSGDPGWDGLARPFEMAIRSSCATIWLPAQGRRPSAGHGPHAPAGTRSANGREQVPAFGFEEVVPEALVFSDEYDRTSGEASQHALSVQISQCN